MRDIHLKRPGFSSSACVLFTKNKQRRDIYKNELDKAYFQHNMAYQDFKDLTRRTASDKEIKHLMLLKTQNMMNIKEVLVLSFINFVIKKPQVAMLIMKLNKINSKLNDCSKQLNTIKKISFYYVLLIFLVNMHGLIL